MIITSPEQTYTVDQYDFLLTNGKTIQVSLDLRVDTIFIDNEAITIRKEAGKLAGRAFPAEDVVLLRPHVMMINHRERQVSEPSEEAQP